MQLVTKLRSEIEELKGQVGSQEASVIAGAVEMEGIRKRMEDLVEENKSLKAVQQIAVLDGSVRYGMCATNLMVY